LSSYAILGKVSLTSVLTALMHFPTLLDSALTAGLVPSFAYLSLQAAHQRGHGSLYAALAKGRMDVEGIRNLVASTLPKENRPVYAIDTSTFG
jgi:hypothetical protein